MPSIAENYFEKYTGPDAVDQLSALPSAVPKQQEDNWLDFKSGRAATDDDIKKIWAKALEHFK